jgi:hydroxymethylpyrimidine/phosphomethylpyrimidine kinase
MDPAEEGVPGSLRLICSDAREELGIVISASNTRVRALLVRDPNAAESGQVMVDEETVQLARSLLPSATICTSLRETPPT